MCNFFHTASNIFPEIGTKISQIYDFSHKNSTQGKGKRKRGILQYGDKPQIMLALRNLKATATFHIFLFFFFYLSKIKLYLINQTASSGFILWKNAVKKLNSQQIDIEKNCRNILAMQFIKCQATTQVPLQGNCN